jgi:outer membrane immunogenic protein
MLRKTLMTSVALVAISGAAMAADLPARMAPAYAPLPVFTWSGFYLGLNGGGGVASISRDGYYDTNPISDRHHNTGYFAGGQIGYNMQISPNFVLGIEADFQGSNFNKGINCAAGPDANNGGSCYDDSSSASLDIRNFGTVRGRLGYAMNQWLFFVTGGLAYGDVRYSVQDYSNNNCGGIPVCSGTGSTSKMQVGWAVGAGVEYAINQNWSVKLEYLHLDLGNKSMTPAAGYNANNNTPTNDFTAKIKATADLARFGVNYRF